eukprot:COSAG06_NODE_686_length_13075_cov_22.361381_12_plen_96_part_00
MAQADSAQPVDMDTFPEAADVIERLNRDHTAELDEQLQLFADSRQMPTTFQHLADTVEFLIQRLKDTYCKMIRAAMADYGNGYAALRFDRSMGPR